MKRVVIGLVGGAGSGKNTIANYLKENGFAYHSLSDEIRSSLDREGIPHGRINEQSMGNRLREDQGPDVLAKHAVDWANDIKCDKIVIDSIRNPEEVKRLREDLDAVIIAVVMSPEKSFELLQKRQRAGEIQTREEFQTLVVDREKGIGEKSTGQQVEACLERVDLVISNERGKEEVLDLVHEFLINTGIIEGYPHYRERR